MARATITVHSLDDRNSFLDIATLETQVDASSRQAEFRMSERDDKYLILVHNSGTSAANVTVKAGNGIQGVADLTHSVAASSYATVSLDSGAYKNVSGDDKGKVIIEGSATGIKIAVFKLP